MAQIILFCFQFNFVELERKATEMAQVREEELLSWSPWSGILELLGGHMFIIRRVILLDAHLLLGDA